MNAASHRVFTTVKVAKMQEQIASALVSNDNRGNSFKKGKVCPGVR